MAKSEFVKRLDEIQAAVSINLKPLSFRKKGRSYNRKTTELIQVINFQMGNYPIGDYVIPGIRESSYGQLAINLGVLLPCVYRVEWQKNVPDFCQESNCTIRERVGSLAYGRDKWFDLTDVLSSLSNEVVRAINEFGIPFLNQFQDYDSVLEYYYSRGRLPFQNEGRASLEAAIIEDHLANSSAAKQLFVKAALTSHKGFRNYVIEIAKQLGYEIPEIDEMEGAVM
jgi:hypothetical protein